VPVDLTPATPADLARVLHQADAMVFAAGSSYESTAQESIAINLDAAIACIDAAAEARLTHFTMTSALGNPPEPLTATRVVPGTP
jgi:uncharacterized protein YbjT (DUF2867 family)